MLTIRIETQLIGGVLLWGRPVFYFDHRVEVMPTEAEEQELVSKMLKGRTMRVYSLLLTNDKLGVREVQRTLGFSSPSLALHHLTKLCDMDLVDKNTHGEYFVTEIVKAGSLSLFVRIGKVLLPRFVFLATLLIGALISYGVFFMSWPVTGGDIMFIGVCVVALIVVLYESRRVWLLAPF